MGKEVHINYNTAVDKEGLTPRTAPYRLNRAGQNSAWPDDSFGAVMRASVIIVEFRVIDLCPVIYFAS